MPRLTVGGGSGLQYLSLGEDALEERFHAMFAGQFDGLVLQGWGVTRGCRQIWVFAGRSGYGVFE